MFLLKLKVAIEVKKSEKIPFGLGSYFRRMLMRCFFLLGCGIMKIVGRNVNGHDNNKDFESVKANSEDDVKK